MRKLLVMVALVGCSHRTSLRHVGQERGEEGTLRLKNGEAREVTLVALEPTAVVVSERGQVFPVGYQHVESFEYTSRSGGAWQGFKYGALVGAVIGVLWGLGISSGTDDDDALGEPGEAMALGVVAFGLGGIIFGPPIGAIKGKTTVYATDER